MTSQGLTFSGVRVGRISIHPVIALGNITRPTLEVHFVVPRSCSVRAIVSGTQLAANIDSCSEVPQATFKPPVSSHIALWASEHRSGRSLGLAKSLSPQ
jgi:hypothetical protein